VDIYKLLGHVHNSLDNHNKAIECFKNSLDINRRQYNEEEVVGSLIDLGEQYLKMDKLPDSLVQYKMAKNIN
jgi:tetratricopeptide (TPR) repeat protein